MKPEVRIRIKRVIVDHAAGERVGAAELAEAIQVELSRQGPVPSFRGRSTAAPSRPPGNLASLIASEIANRLDATDVGASFAAATGQGAVGRGGRP